MSGRRRKPVRRLFQHIKGLAAITNSRKLSERYNPPARIVSGNDSNAIGALFAVIAQVGRVAECHAADETLCRAVLATRALGLPAGAEAAETRLSAEADADA